MKANIIQKEGFEFPVQFKTTTHKYLIEEERALVLSKHPLQSGTSIATNTGETPYGQTVKDFIFNISILFEEAWKMRSRIQLLPATSYLESKEAPDSLEKNDGLCRVRVLATYF